MIGMGTMIDIHSLQKYSLFGGLLPDQIERIIPLFGQERYVAGDSILKEGERNDRIFFILQGRVEVSRRGRVLLDLGEGDAFGEMELLDVQPTVASITSLDHTVAATISNRAVHEIYRMDAKVFAIIMMNLARDLSRRLRHMDEAACDSA